MKKEHQVFVDELRKHGDARRAFIAAYPHTTVHTGTIQTLLQRPDIAEQLKDVEINKDLSGIKRDEPQKEIFVQEFLAYGDYLQAYNKAFPGTRYPEKAALDLLNTGWVQQRIRQFRSRADELLAQQLATKQEFIFLSYAQKRDLLRRIATGVELGWKSIRIGDEWKLQQLPADFSDRLRAIEIDNRMSGDNNPEKNEKQEIITFNTLVLHGKEYEL